MAQSSNSIIYGPNGRVISSGSGYGDAGASYKKRALKGFEATSGSPLVDIDVHNSTLRQRSRMLYMASPFATSGIKTNRTNVIGCGLKLKSRLQRKILGLSAEEAMEMEKLIELEFSIWATNKRSCDATGVNDFYAMQQQCLIGWLMSGDEMVIFKHGNTNRMNPYSLRLLVVEADRVSTPTTRGIHRPGVVAVDGKSINYLLGTTEGKAENGNKIHDGVEVDESGAIVAYHICSEYPVGQFWGSDPEWTRVEAYGEITGRPNILHIMDSERAGQYRGVPYLSHVIEPILQTRRYTESELSAAVIESFYTAFIKTDTQDDGMPMNEIGETISNYEYDYEMGPGTVNHLLPGEDVSFADPKRPTSGFAGFTRAMAEQIGAALEIPADLLLKSFNSSYSASRAALLEAWKAFSMRREWFVSDFCRPVYEEWFAEAVSIGRINAPGFFEDPRIRAAWLGSEWIGPAQGQLDPVKEITAKKMAIDNGLMTREQAAVELGNGSWDDIVEQLKNENTQMAEANAPLSEEFMKPQQEPITELSEDDITNINGQEENTQQNVMRGGDD